MAGTSLKKGCGSRQAAPLEALWSRAANQTSLNNNESSTPMKAYKYCQQSKLEFCQDSTHRNRLIRRLNTLMAFAVILVLSATSARAFTNYLANPGFETGAASPWLDTYTSHSVDSTTTFVYGSGTTPCEVLASGRHALGADLNPLSV